MKGDETKREVLFYAVFIFLPFIVEQTLTRSDDFESNMSERWNSAGRSFDCHWCSSGMLNYFSCFYVVLYASSYICGVWKKKKKFPEVYLSD